MSREKNDWPVAWFGHVRPCSTMFGHVRPCSAMFGYVRPCSAMFGHVRLFEFRDVLGLLTVPSRGQLSSWQYGHRDRKTGTRKTVCTVTMLSPNGKIQEFSLNPSPSIQTGLRRRDWFDENPVVFVVLHSIYTVYPGISSCYFTPHQVPRLFKYLCNVTNMPDMSPWESPCPKVRDLVWVLTLQC